MPTGNRSSAASVAPATDAVERTGPILKSRTYRCPIHGRFSYAARGENVRCPAYRDCIAIIKVLLQPLPDVLEPR
jgi:hypothetical protein